MISIIDYGVGNTASLGHFFSRINLAFKVTNDPQQIKNSTCIVFPGVGSFDVAIENLRNNSKLMGVLENKCFVEKKPVLGICLGMQLFGKSSEEGSLTGLNWLEGETIRLTENNKNRVNIGWSSISNSGQKPTLNLTYPENRFYFNHAFVFKSMRNQNVIYTHAIKTEIPAIIRAENIWGLQFHPEKSYMQGMLLVKKILEKDYV